MRTLRSLLGSTVLLASVGVAPALAAAPTRDAIGASSWSDTSCGFEVDFTTTFVKETMTTFTDANGQVTRLLVTGPAFGTVTNTATGTTITVNVSGPAMLDFANGRIYANGRGIGPLAGFTLAIGYGHVNLDTLVIDGHAVELCDLLG